MPTISIALPDSLNNVLEKLVKEGYYGNRSELLRVCIRETLPKILEDSDKINLLVKGNKLTELATFLRIRGFKVEDYSGVRFLEEHRNKYFKQIIDPETHLIEMERLKTVNRNLKREFRKK